MDYFGQFVGYDPCFVQAVKIKMRDYEFWRFIFPAERKCGASYLVAAVRTTDQAPGKGCFAAA
jgi:hypothetical protein